MPAEVQGQRLFLSLDITGRKCRKYLNPPDLMVHYTGTASQRRPAVLGPPLAAFIPSDWFSTKGIGRPCPKEALRLAIRRARDIN
jgi:hypothetical protein